MTVLSLFDGVSAGQVALDRLEMPVTKYYASEIDKYAITITMANHPNTIQLGDVTKWREWDIDFSKIDLLLAGFPCQAWSIAGKQGGDTDPRGALVHDLIDIWSEIKKHNPEVKFLFENVRMKTEFITYINKLFGVDYVEINSSLVSAQNRKRLYWTNIKGDAQVLFGCTIGQPKDKGILLKDIIDGSENQTASMVGRRIDSRGKRADDDKTIPIKQVIEIHQKGKSNCITTVAKDNIVIIDRGKAHCIDANYAKGTSYKEYKKKHRRQLIGKQDSSNNLSWRSLTPKEVERLFTFPDNYTNHVSKTRRYHGLGNSWTVDVICHIFKGLK